MDISGYQQLELDHDVYKQRLDQVLPRTRIGDSSALAARGA
jgi:hypothetical protein